MSIIGTVLISTIPTLIDRALDRLSKDPSVSLQPKDVPVVREMIARDVVKEVESVVKHSTNQEPAIKSRVTQGNVVAVLGAVVTIMQLWSDDFVTEPTEYVAPLTIIVGALWSLYGRWVAKKPVGE